MQTESNIGGGGVTTFEVDGQKFIYDSNLAKAQYDFHKAQESELESNEEFVRMRANVFKRLANSNHAPKEIKQQG